jgi:hypothetical protein
VTGQRTSKPVSPSGSSACTSTRSTRAPPRPFAHVGHEPLDRLALSLEDGLDRPVRPVPNPAGDAARERAALRGLAEEDALDVSLDDDAAALHPS